MTDLFTCLYVRKLGITDIENEGPPEGLFPVSDIDTSRRDFLMEVARRLNKNCPIVVDKDTELSNVYVLGEILVYNYSLVNLLSEDAAPEIIGKIPDLVINDACTTPETLDVLLKQGITVRYIYRDSEMDPIYQTDVSLEDCK